MIDTKSVYLEENGLSVLFVMAYEFRFYFMASEGC